MTDSTIISALIKHVGLIAYAAGRANRDAGESHIALMHAVADVARCMVETAISTGGQQDLWDRMRAVDDSFRAPNATALAALAVSELGILGCSGMASGISNNISAYETAYLLNSHSTVAAITDSYASHAKHYGWR